MIDIRRMHGVGLYVPLRISLNIMLAFGQPNFAPYAACTHAGLRGLLHLSVYFVIEFGAGIDCRV
jgi:hypothetical protein